MMPPEVIDQIRLHDRTPQVWLSGNSLPLLMVSNQFTPLVTDEGKAVVGFYKNFP